MTPIVSNKSERREWKYQPSGGKKSARKTIVNWVTKCCVQLAVKIVKRLKPKRKPTAKPKQHSLIMKIKTAEEMTLLVKVALCFSSPLPLLKSYKKKWIFMAFLSHKLCDYIENELELQPHRDDVHHILWTARWWIASAEVQSQYSLNGCFHRLQQ